MNSAKLKNRYRQKAQSSQAVERVKALRKQLEALPVGGGDGGLLEMSFVDWCASIEMSTLEGLKPVTLFPWQKSFADLILGDEPLTRRTITLLSSRQTGKTSILLLVAAYLAQARRQFNTVVVHRTTADSHLLCRRLKMFLGKVSLKTDSLSLLEFNDSGSQIHFRSANPNKSDGSEQVGRGLPQVSLAIFDEASHSANLKDCVTVLAPALTWSQMGLMVFIGTASSKQSYFYETLVNAAESDENLQNLLSGIRAGHAPPFQVLDRGKGGVGVITHWQAIQRFNDEPDFLGRVQSEFDLSDEQIATEYQLDFASALDSAVFDFSLVMSAQDETLSRYAYTVGDVLFFGLDPAGQGKDYAVCIALKCIEHADGTETFEAYPIYRKRTGTSEQHLSSISNLITEYRPIRVSVEKNSMGQVWLENLSGLSHDCQIEGFTTSQSSKAVLVGRLQIALERNVLRIPKSVIIDELLAYRRTDSGKLEAGGNAHDDTVIALALALHSARFNR